MDVEAAAGHMRRWMGQELGYRWSICCQLLGLTSIEATLPYARLVRGSLEGEMAKLDKLFADIVSPVEIAA